MFSHDLREIFGKVAVFGGKLSSDGQLQMSDNE